jgi:cell division protein FtsL
MHKIFNACLVIAVLISGFYLYSLEHSTRDIERLIAKAENGILEERELIKVLSAEWASLSRPARLQKLAEENLQLKTVSALQFATEGELASRVPAEPAVMLNEIGEDPIGEILNGN